MKISYIWNLFMMLFAYYKWSSICTWQLPWFDQPWICCYSCLGHGGSVHPSLNLFHIITQTDDLLFDHLQISTNFFHLLLQTIQPIERSQPFRESQVIGKVVGSTSYSHNLGSILNIMLVFPKESKRSNRNQDRSTWPIHNNNNKTLKKKA